MSTSQGAAEKEPFLHNCQSTTCGRMSTNMRLCAGCRRAHYCSPSCQKDDWKSHKVLCKVNAKATGKASAAKTGGDQAAGLPQRRLLSDLKKWIRAQRDPLTWGVAQALHLRSNPSNASSLCLGLSIERTSFPDPPKSFRFESMIVGETAHMISFLRERNLKSHLGASEAYWDELVRRPQAISNAQSGVLVPLIFIWAGSVTGTVIQIVPAGLRPAEHPSGFDPYAEIDDWEAKFKQLLLLDC
ncbi:hypothetical protein JB92DRAFT_2983271 [Gautieria morchelliformis]|nr:hypothetical protein JB92DRAFT_2983271 [Gautieria morchelliformis]